MRIRSTTIVAVIRDGKIAMAGDGQVTLDKTVMKHGARKVRRIAGGAVIAGFAGSAADGITLLEKFEGKLNASGSNLMRAAVELAKDWRQDRALRRLEAKRVISADVPLSAKSGERDKRYRVADPYLRFYLAFVQKGLPLVERGRGDLVVTVLVDTPSDLTQAQEELLRQLGETMVVENTPTSRGLFEKVKEMFS